MDVMIVLEWAMIVMEMRRNEMETIRKSIVLDEESLKKVEKIAGQEERSVSYVIRKAIKKLKKN